MSLSLMAAACDGTGGSAASGLRGVWRGREMAEEVEVAALWNLLQILVSNRPPPPPSIQKAVIASFFKPLASVCLGGCHH